ncbi:hypothetical protein [Amycolatopsis saalfeldensis]|uniref:Uncharacterized protein n=1 Tax=Amycolatopsis saalfeldensis TaxID=394193 RepID=A0A1H8T165_9PSEU|nr:hypothetical protein [Amycolatopsis saalfeldensis]SEO84720.1 hypothetical protein SAMN04489732_102383 [Amycolatopsis saalfeldensis]
MTGNPVDRWLSGTKLASGGADRLTKMQLATQLGHDVPPEVLSQWGHEIVIARRVVDQSEPAFIAEARRQGWSWERIADRLGLPAAEAAEQRQTVLEAELTRTHPRNLPGAWRP